MLVGLLHKCKSYGVLGQKFGLIFRLNNRRLWVVLGEMSSQEYPVNAGSEASILLGATIH